MRDTKAGPEGKRWPLSPCAWRGARPSTPPGQRPPNFCNAGSPLVAEPAWGLFAYFRAGCPRFPRTAGAALPPPHFLASLSSPSVPAPRAGSRCSALSLPLVGDACPTKGPGSWQHPSARSTGMVKRWGQVVLVGLGGAGGPVSLIWQLQSPTTSHLTYVSPTAPLSWPTGFREEVPLGLPAHWVLASRRSLLSGSQF